MRGRGRGGIFRALGRESFQHLYTPPVHSDLRVLWGSPLPPIRSGIADYAIELLPELVRLARVRVLRPPGWTAPGDWPRELETVPADTKAAAGEISLIHLGNNPYHLWLNARLTEPRSPTTTVVVPHDVVLHHLLVAGTVAAGDRAAFARLMSSAHGEAGVALAAARAVGISGRLDPFLLPSLEPFLARATGVVVHSAWAEAQVRRVRPELPVAHIALAVADPGPARPSTERSRLGLGRDEVVLMHLGFLTREKGLHEILGGVAAAVRCDVPVRLVVVGEGTALRALEHAAAAAGISDRVVTTGWVESESLPRLPAAADLGVVLRTPSAGETSAAALRFLACGVPVAVGGTRQFLEWPELAAPRLTPGPAAAADLARLLHLAGRNGWAERRRAARAAYENGHQPAAAARKLVGFLSSLPIS
jgi:glycosyltransferase involved in cell wall biosynthesis